MTTVTAKTTALLFPAPSQWMPRALSIRSLLALLGLALITPALVFTGALVLREAHADRTRVEERLHQIAQSLANTVDRDIDRMLAVLDNLAVSPTIVDRDYFGFQERASSAPHRIGGTVLLVDPDGRTVVNTRVPYGTPLPPYSAVVALERARIARAPVVSSLFTGKVSQRHVFDVLLPVRSAGAEGHVVAMSLTAEHLLQILRDQPLPHGWITEISDASGIGMARLADHEQFVGRLLPRQLLEASETGRIYSTLNIKGEPTLRAVAMSKRTGWRVSANAERAVVEAQLRNAQLGIAALGGTLLILALTLAAFVAKRIVDPIRQLARTAVLERAGPSVPYASPIVEANEIASTLAAASSQLRSRLNQVNLAQSAAGLVFVDVDLVGKRFSVSDNFSSVFGYVPDPDEKMPFADFVERIHVADRARVAQAHEAAMSAVGPFDYDFRLIMPDGRERWIKTQGLTTGGADGAPERMIATSQDVTNVKKHEEHVRFLMGEIVHRSKNQMAIIQSISRQTARSSDNVEDFNTKFTQRLNALAVSNDLLIAQNWEGAGLRDLVLAQLATFVTVDEHRTTVTGPGLFLIPKATHSLGLALHELATNAVKYGALSNQEGRVDVCWQLRGRGPNRELVLEWRERGGPSVVAPARKGFGSTLLDRLIGQQLQATVATKYEPTGLVWTCVAPLAAVGEAQSLPLARPA